MPSKVDTTKPNTSKPVTKPATKKDTADKKKDGVVNLDDEWLYHSRK
jgi:hypothetical protein